MPEKTVYFLGAGASKALFNLPIMQVFFNDFSVKDYEALSKFLSQYFFNGLEGIELEHEIKTKNPNLEEIITAIELSMDKVGSFGKHPESYFFKARSDYDLYVREKLKIDDTSKLADIYEKVKHIFEDMSKAPSDTLKPINSLITLNYNLGLDYILHYFAHKDYDRGEMNHRSLLGRMYAILGKTVLMSGERPSLYWETKDYGFYIKLHGSLDWLYCPYDECGNHQLFFPNWIVSDKIYNYPGEPCILCGSPLVSVIVPPTLHKSFQKYPKLWLLWSLAYRELNKADKIVIFGVSFAPSDYYLRWLFKSSIGSKPNNQKPIIEIVNTNQDTCGMVQRITGAKVLFRGDFEDYLRRT